jgi:hypothetical protein
VTQIPAWRWWMLAIFVIFFPIVFHPWWLAVISIAIFAAIVALGIPKKNSK